MLQPEHNSTPNSDKALMLPLFPRIEVAEFGAVDMVGAARHVESIYSESRTNLKVTLQRIHRLVFEMREPFGITQAHWLNEAPAHYLAHLHRRGALIDHFTPKAQERILELSSHPSYSRLRQRSRMRSSVAPIDEPDFIKSTLGPEIKAALITTALRSSTKC